MFPQLPDNMLIILPRVTCMYVYSGCVAHVGNCLLDDRSKSPQKLYCFLPLHIIARPSTTHFCLYKVYFFACTIKVFC